MREPCVRRPVCKSPPRYMVGTWPNNPTLPASAANDFEQRMSEHPSYWKAWSQANRCRPSADEQVWITNVRAWRPRSCLNHKSRNRHQPRMTLKQQCPPQLFGQENALPAISRREILNHRRRACHPHTTTAHFSFRADNVGDHGAGSWRWWAKRTRRANPAPVHRFVHGHLNRRTTQPRTTSRKIPQPRRGSKHFQATDRNEQEQSPQHHRQDGIFCGMGFDSMTISTQDVGRSKQLSPESRRPNETYHDERPWPKETIPSKRRRHNEVMFSRKTWSKRTSSCCERMFQRQCSFRRGQVTEANDSAERTTHQQEPPTTHQHGSARERHRSRGGDDWLSIWKRATSPLPCIGLFVAVTLCWSGFGQQRFADVPQTRMNRPTVLSAW